MRVEIHQTGHNKASATFHYINVARPDSAGWSYALNSPCFDQDVSRPGGWCASSIDDSDVLDDCCFG